jgi:hypothetical protein
MNWASPVFPAGIDLQTGCNFQVPKKYFLYLCACIPTGPKEFPKKEFRVPLSSRASAYSQDFHPSSLLCFPGDAITLANSPTLAKEKSHSAGSSFSRFSLYRRISRSMADLNSNGEGAWQAPGSEASWEKGNIPQKMRQGLIFPLTAWKTAYNLFIKFGQRGESSEKLQMVLDGGSYRVLGTLLGLRQKGHHQ